MIRLLLTFLAVLTGLSAGGGQAQARIFAVPGTEIGAAEATQGTTRIAAHPALPAPRNGLVRIPYGRMVANPAPQSRVSIAISTVHIGIDRARE